MEQSYQWLDGYVFIRSKKSWLQLCGDWQADEYRYVGRLEPGGSDADRIAVFCDVLRSEKDASDHLKAKMDKAVSRANPSSSTATATDIGTMGPTRWSEKRPWGAYLRITADDGMARSLFARLDPGAPGAPFQQERQYYGHALCSGDWDVLLELGADSAQALDGLIARAQALPGVKSSIVSKIKNAITPPPTPGKCEDWVDG